MTALLRFEGVQKSFETADGPVPVLRGIDLTLEGGQTLALTGESGSGKSTLLHLAGGLDTADAGHVRIDGADLTTMGDTQRAALRRRDIAVVFQQFNLIPSLNVADNIAFQARLSGAFDPELVTRLSDRLGLTSQLRKYPEALSGGQQQRVAIARAVAARPRLLLADEPTGNLDEETAAEVMAEMRDLVSETGAALLVVTHSPTLADQMQTRVHLRSGRVQ